MVSISNTESNMADTEEDVPADGHEQHVSESKDISDEEEAPDAADGAKQVEKRQAEHEEGEEQESKPPEAEDEAEAKEQEVKLVEDEEEKAEDLEAEGVAADEEKQVPTDDEKQMPVEDGRELSTEEYQQVGGDEEKSVSKETEEYERVQEEDEAKMETLDQSELQTQVVSGERSVGDIDMQDFLADSGQLEATTPDSRHAEEEGKLLPHQKAPSIPEDNQLKRAELIDMYNDAMAQKSRLHSHNIVVQSKLFEYMKKKKSEDGMDYEKSYSEQDQRYLKFMAQLEELRNLEAAKRGSYHIIIEDMKEKCMVKKSRADGERKKFIEFKKSVALRSIDSQTGKKLPEDLVEQYVENEYKKEQEVLHMRLENIKLKNQMKKNEQRIKMKEQVSEGLHLIDFEQLKIENQTYNEKIEERNEELLKFRKKITSTVQILTHLKEKLQFMQAENLVKHNELKVVDATLAQSRDILSRTKQARDALKIDNNKLRQKCGFLGNESLLRDFEEQKDESAALQKKVDELMMKHASLMLHCNHVRQKVEEARHTLV